MFNLEKYEKLIILLLVLSLLIALTLSFHKKSNPSVDIGISGFASGSNPPYEEMLEGPKININEAEIEELMKLKGIGRALADRIVDYRQAHGPFQSVEDVMKVKGVGKALFEKIQDRVDVK